MFIDSVSVIENPISPQLLCHDDTNPFSCSIISKRYNVSFTTVDCGYNMPLMSSSENYTSISRLYFGTPPVTGTFDLTFEDHTIYNISSSIEPTSFENLLEQHLPNEGAFDIDRKGDCSGYSWSIEWTERGGDRPLMTTDNSRLLGHMVDIAVSTVVDGGVWIRAFRGDMLRLPELSPQVTIKCIKYSLCIYMW